MVTTTALVFCTVHPESVDALFEARSTAAIKVNCGRDDGSSCTKAL